MVQLTLDKIGALFDMNLDSRPISGIAYDSREVQPGQLFVALKGQKVDGHDFIDEAIKKGAKAVVVSQNFPRRELPVPVIAVADPLEALQKIARSQLAHLRAKVIGVTGSVGKTTTKEFLYQILKSKYKTVATPGNLNTQISMATSLVNSIQGDEEFVVVEMGMTLAGHIRKLVEIIAPDMALMTTIGLAHAENFDSIEDIARAKAEIFSHPKTDTVIICKDSPCSDLLCELAPADSFCYSIQDREANFFLEVAQDHLRFCDDEEELFGPFVKFPAPHVYLNCLGACSMARMCSMSWQEIFQVLPKLVMPEKRLEKVVKGGITFINDSYNASETSLKGALSSIKQEPCQGKRIAVIGQMRELGKFSVGCHEAVGQHALSCVDKVFCLGDECRPLVEVCKNGNMPVEWFIDFAELADSLKKNLKSGDLVLLKGSRSNGLWRVLDNF